MRPTIPTLALLALVGCGGPEVTRNTNAPEAKTSGGAKAVDLGSWSDTDSRQVAAELVPKCTSAVWVTEFTAKNNRAPVIRPAKVTVRADGETINTNIFMNPIATALLETGKVKVRASKDEANLTREDLKDQDVHASKNTKKESFQETGADFLLYGEVGTNHQQEGKRQVKFYQVTLRLVHIQSTELVWQGSCEIQKEVKR